MRAWNKAVENLEMMWERNVSGPISEVRVLIGP